jgi:hypothetical protein
LINPSLSTAPAAKRPSDRYSALAIAALTKTTNCAQRFTFTAYSLL